MFNFGLFPRRFGGNHKITGASINLGSTRGIGSSTRIVNFCQRTKNPYECLYGNPQYTVTYSGNGNTGGTIPVDSLSPYKYGLTVTVLGNTGSLIKTGYTFNGWNTNANGTGTSYLPAATFTINANTILYAQWASWFPLIDSGTTINGLNGLCYSIAISGTKVYVGGSFTLSGGNTANNIAVWDTVTSTWSALGSGLNSICYTIAISTTNIYAGGQFTTAGSNPANYISVWDTNTSTWSALGSGLNNSCNTIAISGTNVYAGGQFTSAGGNSANYIAVYF